MKILIESFLVLARKLKSEHFLRAAYLLATSKNDVLSCYYIACRYFMTSDTGFYVISAILSKHDLSLAQIANPVLEGYNKAIKLDDIRNFKLKIDNEVQGRSIRKFSMLLEYFDLFLSKDFQAAYEVWRGFDDVVSCLAAFEDDVVNKNVSDRKIAVVLPGTSNIEFGEEIDSYPLVARTTFNLPSSDKYKYSGTRFDYAFLNSDRYNSLSDWSSKELFVFSPIIVSNMSCKSNNVKGLNHTPILELSDVDTPISNYIFMALKIAHWCIDNAYLKPTFYNGDFYLNDKLYESESYDSKVYLLHEKNVIDSYLLHDVFYTHACLSVYHKEGLIGAKGALDKILKMSGTEFSEALAKRWS